MMISTYDFGLEERVVEIMQMHVDMVGGDEDSQSAEDEGSVELVLLIGLYALLLAIGPAEGGELVGRLLLP